MTYLHRIYDDDKNVTCVRFEEPDGSYYQWKNDKVQLWDEKREKWKKAPNAKIEQILVLLVRMNVITE